MLNRTASGIRAATAPEKNQNDTVGRKMFMVVRRLPIIPMLIVAIVVFCALFAPYVSPHDPQRISPKDRLMPPAWAGGGNPKYLLGTDSTGRDLLSRIIYGARVSLIVAVLGIGISASLGTFIGLVSGYFGGITDMIIMRFVDIMMSLPVLFLALAFAAVIPAGMYIVILIIAIFWWVGYARIVRGEVLSLKEREFVALAKVAQAYPYRHDDTRSRWGHNV
jgi:peptide/nickel transport system permease protein